MKRCIQIKNKGWRTTPLPGTMWMSRSYAELAPPLTGCSALRSRPHLSPAAALRRHGPVPLPDSTVELALEVEVWVL